MLRIDLIEKLQSKIKSLEFNDLESISWMLMNDGIDLIKDSLLVSPNYKDKHPWFIKNDYGQGIEIEYDGTIYISDKYNPTYHYKRCGLNIMDYKYYGNTHCYCTVHVENVSWREKDNPGRTIMNTKLNEKFPQTTTSLTWNVRRMLFEDDIQNGKGDWEGYEPGLPTERFESVTDLILTSIYTIITRIEGPIRIQSSPLSCFEKKLDLLVIIDENDNVVLRNDIENILK